MAIRTRTWACTKEQSLADFGGGSLRGNGSDDHAPIGLHGGVVFRELLDFDYDFSGMYRIRRAWLVMRTTGQVHVARGANPRVTVKRATEGWRQDGGGENSWSTSAAEKWPGPATTGDVDSDVLRTGDDVEDRILITPHVNAWAPSSVVRSDGRAGSGTSSDRRGLRVQSIDEGSTSRTTEWFSRRASAVGRRPTIEVEYDDNRPPEVPTIRYPEAADPALVATQNGDELTVIFLFTDQDSGDRCTAVALEVYGDAATDTALGTRIGAVTAAPADAGSLNLHSVTLAGLPTRTTMRFRIAVQDSANPGAWSGWTPLADGRFQTAYAPGIPLQPLMTSDPDDTHIFGTIASLDPSDVVTAWQGVLRRHNPDGSVTDMWTPSAIDVSSVRRPDIRVSWSVMPRAGDVISWQHRHTNRDGIVGPWSPEYTTTMVSRVGPTVTPADDSTKLTSRSGPVTIAASSFDAYQYRLYRGDALVHDSGLVTLSSTTSTSVSLPSDKVGWGDRLTIEAAVRPAGTSQLGDFSPRSPLAFVTLPTTVLTVSDGDGFTGTVIPTMDPLLASPYIDPDVALFSEAPAAKQLEIRSAAVPAGSGTLRERRDSVNQITENEHVGRQLDALQSDTGWTPDADVTVGTWNTVAPSGYSGDSLIISADGGSSTPRGASSTVTGWGDLSVFGGGSLLRFWFALGSTVNLTAWRMRVYFVGGGYAEWDIATSATSIGTWLEYIATKGNPKATSGTIDWSQPQYLAFYVAPSAGYTGVLIVRDLRIGMTQTDKDTPDGHLAPESSYDLRARYHDDATVKAATTLAANSAASATNIKVVSVTGFTAGDEVTVGTLTAGLHGIFETRTIQTVGTSGAGGTGITVTEAFAWAHYTGDDAKAHHWGPWSAWVTRRFSRPPTVAADTPADRALLTDPTPTLAHTFSSPGAKAQAYRTTRVYRRLGFADTVLAMGARSHVRLAETSSTYSDELGVLTGTVHGTMTRGVDGLLLPVDADDAVHLDGSTGYITFGDVDDFPNTDAFTVALLVNLDTLPTAGNTMDLHGKRPSSGGGWWVRVDEDGVVGFIRSDGSGYEIADGGEGVLEAGTTALVVAAYDGTSMAVAVGGAEGTPVASSRSLPGNTADLTLGRQANGSAGYVDGVVDELVVWSRGLTAAERATLHGAVSEAPGDELAWEDDVTGTGLTDTLPVLLLSDGTTWAWEKTAYDTDGLSDTTTRRSFSTTYTEPDAVTGLTATADPDGRWVDLAWTASAEPHFAFYVVSWRDPSGAMVRIDLGPRALDDGREALTEATFRHHGAQLGENEYSVAVHDGVMVSAPASVTATLALPPGLMSWSLVTPDDDRHTLRLGVFGAPRTHGAITERFDPPGLGYPIHLAWGGTGRQVRATIRYRPIDMGDQHAVLAEMLRAGTFAWLKAPAGFVWSVMPVRVVALSDAVEMAGWMSADVAFDEVAWDA